MTQPNTKSYEFAEKLASVAFPAPAWFELMDDDVIFEHRTAVRLYRDLMRTPLAYVSPQDVKITQKAYSLAVHPDSVRTALALLIDRGYLHDCGKGFRGIRSVILLIERSPEPQTAFTCPPNQVHRAA